MIKRKLINELKNHLQSKEISLITGPRQAGKTTLMRELVEFLEQRGDKTVFLNLDFESDKTHFSTQTALISKLKLELGAGSGYVFIDEIQRKENAGLFLKGIYDQDLKYKFIVSGSGSLELKEKIHESLAGRKRLFELNTLSFEEFADYRTSYRYEGRRSDFFKIEKIRTKALLDEYMNFGGYPRVVLEDGIREKTMIMDEIYRSYIEKDIAYLLKIDKPEAFAKMIRLLSSQISGLLNYSELASNSGISVPTLKNYLWYAEKTFVINQITPYFSNRLKEITKSPVAYFTDLGMRNYMIGLFGNLQNPADAGHIFQNMTYNILHEKLRFSPVFLHYWRTIDRAEVDFVIKKGETVIPLEVKFSVLKKPELGRSFHSFIEKYNPHEAILVNLDLQADIKIKNTHVKIIPFHELLSYEF
ncbi:MAG TPA: ATPase [Lentisphaeria bacterium]|nr:MAG: ATPase [Lentisphaerae bacterium GWF2_50_93]HCE45356.1 ATPase [Lentisphaeria bacterium]